MGSYVKREWHDGDEFAAGVPRYNHDLKGDHVGIELELDLDHSGSYARILEALPDPPAGVAGPLTEFDGSLSSYGGVEIIFPPIPASTFGRNGSFFKTAINSLDAGVGSAAVRSNCGMHININVADWNQLTKDLTLLLFHYLPPELIEKVGGRRPFPNSYYQQLGVNPQEWFTDSYRNSDDDYEEDDWEDENDQNGYWCSSCGDYH